MHTFHRPARVALCCGLISLQQTTTLCIVCRGRDVSSTSSPVDVNVLALRVIRVGIFRLDPEGVGTEVITLGLQKVGG